MDNLSSSSSVITDNQFKAWLNDLHRIAPEIANRYSEDVLRIFCKQDYRNGIYTSNGASEEWINTYGQANDYLRNNLNRVSPEEAYVQDRIGYTNKQVAPYSSTKQLQTATPKDIRAYTPNYTKDIAPYYTRGTAPDYIDAEWSEVVDKLEPPKPPKPPRAINAGNASRFLGVSVPVVQSWASGLGAAYGAPEGKGGNFFSRGFEGGIKDAVRDAVIGAANLAPASALINYATDDSINKAIANAIPETNMNEKGYIETAGDWIGNKLYNLFNSDALDSVTKSSTQEDLDASWAANVDASRAIDPTAAARSYSADNSNYPTQAKQAKQDAQNYVRSVTGSDTNAGSSSLSKRTNASNSVDSVTSNKVATANNARPSAQVTSSYDTPTTININGTSYDVRDMEKFRAMMDNPSMPYGAREEASYIWNALKAQRDARYSNWRR